MHMHMHPSRRALCLSLLLGMPAYSQANDLPPGAFDTGIAGLAGIFLEDRLSFNLVLNGGLLTHDAFNTVDLGKIWQVHLDIRLIDEDSKDPINDAGVDLAIVSGTVFHLLPPHAGEGLGTPLNFSFSVLGATAMTNPVAFNGLVKAGSNAIDLDHGGVHKDHYSGSAGNSHVSTHLLSWSTSLSGRHPDPVADVPEPAMLHLLLLGLPVLGWSALRRARAARSSPA